MKIPNTFFGTLQEVKNKCRKLNTKMRKGASLEECVEEDDFVESSNFPESLFWIDKAWSMEGNRVHFPLCQYTRSLLSDDRISNREANKIIDANIAYLATTFWGTIIINGRQDYVWANTFPQTEYSGFRKIGLIAIMEGYTRFFLQLKQQGRRFFSGATGGRTFEETQFLVSYVVANLGNKYSEKMVELARESGSQINDYIFNVITTEKLIERLRSGS